MAMKKIMSITLACLMMSAVLTGCGCQARKTEPSEPTPVMETKAVPEETVENTDTVSVETTEPAQAVETTAATEATRPTVDNSWIEEVPEDTRPPIEVIVPDETQSYTDYERYMDMSGEEQEAFFDSFEDEDAFFDWFNKAKEEYEKAHPPVIVDGSTNIEIKP